MVLGFFWVALAAQGAGRACFPATAQVPVFEGLAWKEDGVFASFLGVSGNQVWSLQAFGDLCKPSEVSQNFLESLQASWRLCKPLRFFASHAGSLQALGVFQSFLGSLQASGGLCGATAAMLAVGKILNPSCRDFGKAPNHRNVSFGEEGEGQLCCGKVAEAPSPYVRPVLGTSARTYLSSSQ